MATVKKHRSDQRASSKTGGPNTEHLSFKMTVLSALTMIFGPLFLIYLTLRCEKNQCVLLQFPLVIPTHLSAYWSPIAQLIVIAFIGLMFLLSVSAVPITLKGRNKDHSTALASLICTSTLLIVLAYPKPEYIHFVHGEYLRMLIASAAVCICISAVLFCLAHFKVIRNRDRVYSPCMSLFHGSNINVNFAHVELKYFFYVCVGIVAWALLDLLIVLHVVIDQHVTAPLVFLAVSQFMVIFHTLLYERVMHIRPFVKTEALGFFWLMRVLMYQPFFHSLPLYYVAATDLVLPIPVILTNSVLFLLGFIIYISSIHQRENFCADPGTYKNLKSVGPLIGNSRRFLASGYWGIVQKPDYLGLLIIWLSWTVACGFSAFSVLLLLVMVGTVYMWLEQSSRFKLDTHGTTWTRYTMQVPKRIIPLVF